MRDSTIVNTIRQAYINKLRSDSSLQKILRDAESGKASMSDLQKFAKTSGALASKTLEDVGASDPDSLKASRDLVIRELSQLNNDAINQASNAIQKAMLNSSGLDLNPVSVSMKRDTLQQAIDAFDAEDDIEDGASKAGSLLQYASQQSADESEQKSAEFQSESGLEVLVTREYDDVGVHTTDKGGGVPCQWCLDRCGTDVPYDEAYERGMFERHPGCGCIITYRSKRGDITKQGKDREWHEEQSDQVRRRIDRLEKEDHIKNAKTPRQREFEASIRTASPETIAPQLIDQHEALGDYTPSSLKSMLGSTKYHTEPLTQGSLKGIDYNNGGGYKVVFGEDGLLQYHPAGGRHHNSEAYYKISSGKTGIKRYHLDGSEKND